MTLRFTVKMEASPLWMGAALHTITSGGGLIYLQHSSPVGPVTTAVTLAIGISYGHLLASWTRQVRS